MAARQLRKAGPLRPRQVRLISGHTARSKVLGVAVADDETAAIADRLRELLKAGP